MPFSALKMHFFDKNGNLIPCLAQPSGDDKELFFPMVFFYLNSKGKLGASWGTW